MKRSPCLPASRCCCSDLAPTARNVRDAGQRKAQSKLAAAAFLTAAISLFSMVALSLVYASFHQIDYAAAGEPSPEHGAFTCLLLQTFAWLLCTIHAKWRA